MDLTCSVSLQLIVHQTGILKHYLENSNIFNEFYFGVNLLLGLQTVWLLCQYNGEQKWGGEQRKWMEFWFSKHFHNIVDIKMNNNLVRREPCLIPF